MLLPTQKSIMKARLISEILSVSNYIVIIVVILWLYNLHC